MFYRNKKTRKYQAPGAKVTEMLLEKSFCLSGFIGPVQVDELHNINADSEALEAEETYFEF